MFQQTGEPPRGSGLQAVADIAGRRGHAWRALAGMFAEPSLDWVQRLRDGRTHTELKDAVGFRSGQESRFGPPLVSLEAFSRIARRRTDAADHDTLRREHERLLASAGPDLLAQAEVLADALATQCRDEAAAWAALNTRKGRSLRAHQAGLLREGGADCVVRAAEALLAATPRQPYAALAAFAVQWFGVEVGGEVADSLR